MKIHWQATSLLLAVSAAARDATVHVFGVSPSKDFAPPDTLDANSARLVFAQILGLSEFHSLELADSDTIRALNSFGLATDGLFGHESSVTKTRSFAIIEGFAAKDAVISSTLNAPATFTIHGMPSASQSDRLLNDFKAQNEDLQQRQLRLSSMNRSVTGLQISKIAKGHAGSDGQVRGDISHLVSRDGIRIIVVAEPETSAFKRSTTSWGDYETPDKRQNQAIDEVLEEIEEEIEEDVEELLEELGEGRPSAQQKNHTAPRGILPACYASLQECEKTTFSCSGHGSCESKYKYREGSNTRQCFACACNSTVEDVKGGGKLTTRWAGPACQKKDVSEPFWLLAAVTIFLLLIVTAGVGMLFSMGSEELPSVIGAGVAGPRSGK